MPATASLYVGRFAPSPTGPLHAGSLVAALASWLDARAHGGRWLVRIEDVDTPRSLPGLDAVILAQLAALGLLSDEAPVYQSRRAALYEAALQDLRTRGLAYPCTCSRKQILALLQAQHMQPERHGELIYPGTCRPREATPTPSLSIHSSPLPAWRFRDDSEAIGRFGESGRPRQAPEFAANTHTEPVQAWRDRRLKRVGGGPETGPDDFVLQRADGCTTYQLAVVVDDAAQGVTDVVRGEDLAGSTPRQMRLQQALGLPTPRYLHTPLVLAADGQKLSKQNGARALDTSQPLLALNAAAQALGLAPAAAGTATPAALATWVPQWARFLQSLGEQPESARR